MSNTSSQARNSTYNGQTLGMGVMVGDELKQAQNEGRGGQEKAKTPKGAGGMCIATSASVFVQ